MFKEWWTNWRGKTDTKSRCEVKAFFGKHRVTVGGKEKIVELKRSQPSITVSFR